MAGDRLVTHANGNHVDHDHNIKRIASPWILDIGFFNIFFESISILLFRLGP
jgi:hypothetical protein